jgi:hypothetical protein
MIRGFHSVLMNRCKRLVRGVTERSRLSADESTGTTREHSGRITFSFARMNDVVREARLACFFQS